MPPNIDQGGHGQQEKAHAAQKIAKCIGVLERVRSVGPKEAAAVGAELFHRDDGRDRAAGNLLDQGFTAVVCSHRSRLQRYRLRVPCQGHRHATGDEQQPHNKAQRHKDVGRSSPQIDVEIAQVLVAAQTPDHRQQSRHADHRRDRLLPADEEQLAEVG